MKITIIGIPVLNQEKALIFYTEKLGFIKKHDIPVGGDNRWITVVSKEALDGPEISLEPAPNHFEPSKVYQNALMKAGIPYTQFNVENLDKEYERLTKLDVNFSVKPTETPTVKYAIFNDTCGNNIQLVEML